MTDPQAQASDIDLAGQALPADESAEDLDLRGVDAAASSEADPADVVEQHRSVPSDDDGYPVGSGD